VTVLLDANVLIALLVEDHVHHDAAENWFAGISGNFATCPVTQGSLMRLLIREGQPASAAREILNGTAADPRHEFCPDDVSYTNVPTEGIIGHRQVTDGYLAQLARAHGFRLATFDQAMAKLHHDVAELVPDRLPSRVPLGEARVRRWPTSCSWSAGGHHVLRSHDLSGWLAGWLAAVSARLRPQRPEVSRSG
jgi:uncharacterized protein